jgi:hypothetical protein
MGRTFSILLMIAGFLALIPPSYFILQAIEHAQFPVVGKMELLNIEAEEGNTTLVYVKFDKLRDCKYLGISWFRKLPGDVLERATIDIRPLTPLDRSDTNRPVGTQITGPWRIGIPADVIRSTSTVHLTHQCHPLYVTRTVIYP